MAWAFVFALLQRTSYWKIAAFCKLLSNSVAWSDPLVDLHQLPSSTPLSDRFGASVEEHMSLSYPAGEAESGVGLAQPRGFHHQSALGGPESCNEATANKGWGRLEPAVENGSKGEGPRVNFSYCPELLQSAQLAANHHA